MTLSLDGEVTQSFLNLLHFNFTHDLGEPVFSQEPIKMTSYMYVVFSRWPPKWQLK